MATTAAAVRQVQVTFDCAEPARVARFWAAVLGYDQVPYGEDDLAAEVATGRTPGWAACVDPTGAGPRLYFQRVPEGKVVKNRVHLDVRVGPGLVGEERLAVLAAECARLEALGGSRVRLMLADEENESCLVMQDVEGNEFCLD
ncbi:VOC family protein [Actinotalea solisilvae]|uniref:VOC family protein n=1 Tax=Actinotalea solisilvae TaxID=2072922 RepID=UPI0018F22F18|nr:VOC family protein [Actinotalea solisilvae]